MNPVEVLLLLSAGALFIAAAITALAAWDDWADKRRNRHGLEHVYAKLDAQARWIANVDRAQEQTWRFVDNLQPRGARYMGGNVVHLRPPSLIAAGEEIRGGA